MTDGEISTTATRGFYERLLTAVTGNHGPAYVCYGDMRDWDAMRRVTEQVNAVLAGLRRGNIAHYCEKSFEAYGAIFATVLSDNVWAPLTPALPAARNLAVLEMIDPRLILVDRPLPEALAAFAAERGVPVVDLTRLGEDAPRTPIILGDFSPDDIAYIMFTSGSTGAPKGVPMTHLNYINFVENCLNILPFRPGDVFSDYHDFAFDISIFYLFCFPFVNGAISPVTSQIDRVTPLRFMRENKVTVWSSVPSAIRRVAQMYADPTVENPVRIMFLCGEPFSLNVLAYCQENMRVPHVYNFYGLTETGVENFCHPCETGDVERFEPYGFVPIGRPLPGNRIRVAADGELMLAGPQITPGYLAGIGAERFVVIDGERWFYSGDIVEEHDSLWFCKGRKDSQVKLRGYRVELMDVEVNLKRHPAVAEAVCFVGERQGRQALAAVVRLREEGAVSDAELRRDVGGRLPAYMIPDMIFFTADFPVNQNGKIDRRRIRDAWIAAVEGGGR